MSQSLHPAFIDLLRSASLSDRELRCLVGWYALSLADLLQRRCITVRYAEQVLFNLDVVRQLEKRRLTDCVEVIDWGMQLEDWEAHTPEQLPEAISTVAQLAQKLLTRSTKPSPSSTKVPRQRIQRQPARHLS
jgi:Protein of unknown function (DUF3969)